MLLMVGIGFTGVCYFLDRIADAVESTAKHQRRRSSSE